MKPATTIAAILSVFVTLPIWFYLLHQVLVRVGASELMFFLFWIYVPVSALCSVIFKVANAAEARG